MLPTAIVDFPPQRLAFAEPRDIIVAGTIDEVVPAVRRAERVAMDGAWVVGMLAYEAAPAFDPALVVRGGGAMPLAWFAAFDAPLAGDAASLHDAALHDDVDDVAIPVAEWSADTTRAA